MKIGIFEIFTSVFENFNKTAKKNNQNALNGYGI